MKYGVRALKVGRLDEAKKSFQEAVKADASPVNNAHLAWVSYLKEDVDLETTIHRLRGWAKELQGGDQANIYLGHIARDKGKEAAAAEFYRAAYRSNEDNIEAEKLVRLYQRRSSKGKKDILGRLWDRMKKK